MASERSSVEEKVHEMVSHFLEGELRSTLKSLYPPSVLASFSDQERQDLIQVVTNTFVESEKYDTLLARVLQRLRPRPPDDLGSLLLLDDAKATKLPPSHALVQLEQMHVWDWQHQKFAQPLFLDVLGQRPLVLRALQLLQRGYQAAPAMAWPFLMQLMVRDITEKPRLRRFAIVALDAKAADPSGWQLTKAKFDFVYELQQDLQTHWPRLAQPHDVALAELPYQLLCHTDAYAWLHLLDPSFQWLSYMLGTAPGKRLWLQALRSKVPAPLFYALGTFRTGRAWLAQHRVPRPPAPAADTARWLESALARAREREEKETVAWCRALLHGE